MIVSMIVWGLLELTQGGLYVGIVGIASITVTTSSITVVSNSAIVVDTSFITVAATSTTVTSLVTVTTIPAIAAASGSSIVIVAIVVYSTWNLNMTPMRMQILYYTYCFLHHSCDLNQVSR